jgi:transcriptional regulator with XRE-family HTH domain
MGSGVRTKPARTEIEDEEERWARGARTVLQAFRKDADLTQEQLAARMGWTTRMVAGLESGRTAMQIRHVVRVVRALGVDPAAAFAQIVNWVQGQVRRAPGRHTLR